ncbi:MAG: M28 family peptidase [bacterium]
MAEPVDVSDVPVFSVSISELDSDFQALCRIGSRWAGSDGETRCRNFIVASLRTIGLSDIRLESYPYLHYTPRGSKLEVSSPVQESLPTEPIQYSANGDAEGEALFVGEGKPADFDEVSRLGASLVGKIAVVRGKASERFYPAHLYGATGLVVICDAPEDLIRSTCLSPYPPNLTPPFEGQIVPIPGVVTTLSAGDRLLRLMKFGPVRLRLYQQGDYSERTSANVVIRIAGTEQSKKVLAIGAHYDTKFGAGGAVDNSTGVAALCGLARFFARQRPRRTVELIAFSGEEIGLYGSYAFTRAHAEEIRQHYLAMINMDSLTGASAVHYGLAAWPDRLRDVGVMVAKQVGWPVDMIYELNARESRNDAVPFLSLDVPVIRYTEFPPGFGNPYYHTARDLVETVDLFRFHRIVQAVGALAAHLANADGSLFSSEVVGKVGKR